MKRAVLICHDSKAVLNFRKELILFLKNKGYEIDLIISNNLLLDEIKKLGINVHVVEFKNRSKNIFSSYSLIHKFRKVIKQVNPDFVFTFQLKPNLYGTLAARKIKGIKIYNMVEGLGDPFQPTNLIGKLIRFYICRMYRKVIKFSNKVFFLNNSDKDEFIKRNIIKEDKSVVIPGIGIDVNNYSPNYNLNKEIHIVYLSRLIRNKGIYEFCKVARLTREKRKDIFFDLYGDESQITVSDLKEYINDGSINYKGYSNNIKQILADSHLLLSTSYREGFSRSILESMAMGRPVIASDVIGNNSVVVEGVTGYLIEKSDIEGFANKIIELVDNKELVIKLGKQAREYCEKHYNSEVINCLIIEVINS